MLDQRQRRIAALIVVAGLAALAVAFLGNSSNGSPGHRRSGARADRPPRTQAARSTAAPTTATTRPAAVQPPFPVGETTLTVTRAGRQIGVDVLYPARQAGAGGAPLTSRRPYPLIVFSPGFDIAPGVYDALVGRWSSLGFVVAVANYPLTAAGAPGGVNEGDIVQHPADLAATIDDLLAVSNRSASPLREMIDPSRIGVAGHSDGGDVTDAVVSDSCCRDVRIRAAAVLSGAELTSFGGTYGPAGVPLLVVQGDSDTINPPACSEQIYATGGAPRFYLDLHGAGHLPPYTGVPTGTVWQQAVDHVTALFWTAYLDGDTSATSAMKAGAGLAPPARLVASRPVAQLGTCPGAP